MLIQKAIELLLIDIWWVYPSCDEIDVPTAKEDETVFCIIPQLLISFSLWWHHTKYLLESGR